MPNPTHHQTNKSQFTDDTGQCAVSKNYDLTTEYLQRDLDYSFQNINGRNNPIFEYWSDTLFVDL